MKKEEKIAIEDILKVELTPNAAAKGLFPIFIETDN